MREATHHVLKTRAPYFDAVKRGEKRFEIRRDDRGFQRGDLVTLQRMEHKNFSGWMVQYPRIELTFRIGFVLTGGQFGLEPGYVAFSLIDIEEPYRCTAAERTALRDALRGSVEVVDEDGCSGEEGDAALEMAEAHGRALVREDG